MSTRSEIESRLATWASAQKIPVAFENVPFTKPATGSYLEIYMLESLSTNRDVSAQEIRTRGTFQINCYAPVGNGMATVEALASSVIALYPVVPKVGMVSIESPLNGSHATTMEGFMCIPVRGRYRVESQTTP